MPGRNWFRRYIFTPNRHMAAQAALVAAGIGAIFLNVQRLSPDEWRHDPAGTAGLTAMSFNVLLGGQAAGTVLATAGFRDPCNAPGRHCGPTWPGQTLYWPATFRVDHILGRGIKFTDAAVLEAGGSDHYPVAARFRVIGKGSIF